MPLHSEEVRSLDGFDDAVGCPRGGGQFIADVLDGLMVMRIDLAEAAERALGAGAAFGLDAVTQGGVPAIVAVVEVPEYPLRREILNQGAASGDDEKLCATTDSEHPLALIPRHTKRAQLHEVTCSI